MSLPLLIHILLFAGIALGVLGLVLVFRVSKLKSPVYVCFLIGAAAAFTGFAALLLGDICFGSRHWLSHLGKWLFIAGVALYTAPLLGGLAAKLCERLRQRRRQ